MPNVILEQLVDTPFIMYANCNVIYQGRANSTLEDGNYLIIRKRDGSFQVHGSTKLTPKNYQGPRSKLTVDNSTIISYNKKEKIIVNVNNIIDVEILEDWSDHDIALQRTEKELVEKLQSKLDEYIGVNCHTKIREYATDYGPVDLVGIDIDGVKHTIEVKRRKITIKDATQLLRYMECLDNARGYLAGPSISPKALSYLKTHHLIFISLEFD